MGLFGSMAGLPDVKQVVSNARAKVEGRAVRELAELSEEKAKEKLADIAADEVEGIVDEMLGDKKDTVPQRLKKGLVDKACEQVVEQVWDAIKDKIAGGAPQEAEAEATA